MLTAVVWGAVEPRPLAQTLTTLVPAAIDGTLREVAVAGADESGEARFVADHAGCRVLGTETPSAAAETFKGRWVLVVRSGDRLPPGWLDAVLRCDADGARTARIEVGQLERPLWRSLFTPRATALLIHGETLRLGGHASWPIVASAVRGNRLRPLGETRR